MIPVIGFGHKARVGKTSAGLFLSGEYGFEVLHYADPLKQAVQGIFGWTDRDTHQGKSIVDDFWSEKLGAEITPGHMLQQFGTLTRESLHSDIWRYAMEKRIAQVSRVCEGIAICDVRFPSEVELIRGMGGKVYRVDRDDAVVTGRDTSHLSETALDDYEEWDGIIANNGTKFKFRSKLTNIMRDEYGR